MEDSPLARAQVLLDVHRYDEAVRLLGEALASDPEQPAVQMMFARALRLSGRAKEAVQAAERAAVLAPADAEPHCLRAEALLELGLGRPADQAARQACELGPMSARAHFVRVRTALTVGRTDDAWVEANRVLELAPNASLGRQARGLVLIKRKNWREAEAEYRTALSIAPTDPNLHNNYGLALLNLNRETEAIEHFTRAGQLDARQDLYRKNTAVAARRHLGDTGDAGKRSPLLLVVPFGAMIAVAAFGSDNPAVPVIALGVVMAVLIPYFALRRRRRLQQLSPAARIALESDERTRAPSTRLSKQHVRLMRGVVILALVGLVIAGVSSGRHDTGNGTGSTNDQLAKELCQIARLTPTSLPARPPVRDCPPELPTTSVP